MTVAPARDRPAATGLLDRWLAAVPVVAALVWIAFVELLETTWRKSPSLFSDEVEWSQLSRGVAATGHAMAHGEPMPFKSLYTFLIAPAWWIHDTAQAYDMAKYLTIFAMTLAAVPAYLLARRLVVKPAAIAVAAASISIPSMAYGLYLVPEGIAYPWATLCAFLASGALAVRTRWWIAAATVASILAPVVRGQLVIVPVAFAFAAAGLWWTGERGKELRRDWSPLDHVGVVLLAIGAFLALNRWLLHGITPWAITSEFYRGWIWHHVRWSLGALTIGIGVLPLMGGVLVLFPRPGERRDPWERAFTAVLASFVFWFAIYTGVKAAYLQSTFATLVTERNLFYLAPLLFLATAIVVQRRRVRLLPLAAAVVIVVALVATTPLQLAYPYFEAFGFSIVSWANRAPLYFSVNTIENSLYIVVAVCAAILLAVRGLHLSRPATTSALATLACAVIAWNVGGELAGARGAQAEAQTILNGFPLVPANKVDLTVGSGSVTYLGQQLQQDVDGVDLLEFWNRSIEKLWSLDGTAPGPGPTLSPDIRADGTLSPAPGTDYLLADAGVDPIGPSTPLGAQLRLFRLDGRPIRLRGLSSNVGSDGWIVTDGSYTRFVTPWHRPGVAVIHLSRANFCPEQSVHAPVGWVHVVVGDAVVNANHQPVMGRVFHDSHVNLPNCSAKTVRVRVGPPPWRVELHVDGTFSPAQYGTSSDGRTLGAQVGFDYARR